MSKLITLGNLGTFAEEIKSKYARQSALDALQEKVNNLEAAGGEQNKLEGVKVNGTALTIADKMVDILVATGSENGTISVNDANIAVAGLQALAFKANVSEADLDEALKAVLDAKASGADVTALSGRVTTAEGAIEVLNGGASVEGSVANQIADAFAALTGNDTEIKSLQALVDWVDGHAADALEMSNQVNKNKGDIAALTSLVGQLPAGITSTTVVGYIAEAIAGIGIGDYAKTTEVTAAINSALGNYYTKGEVDNKFTSYYKKTEVDGQLASYYKKTEVDSTLASYYKKTEVDSQLATRYTKTEVDGKLASYALKSDIETVSEAEVKALLAE